MNVPTGDFGDVYKTGFGGTVTGRYGINERLNVGLNLGGQFFKADKDKVFNQDVKFRIVPITALVEYNILTGDLKPYVGMDLGLYNARVDVGDANDSDTKFGVAPTAGLNYAVMDNLDLNFNFKYHVVFTEDKSTTFVALGLGVIYYIGDRP